MGKPKTVLEKLHPPDAEEQKNEESDESSCSHFDIIYYTMGFMLWVTVYFIFIELQFGMVYLVSSGLIAMYLNTRTGPKSPDEVSAYSVFNKNCESIDGTLKAEQFEREIRYGPGSVR